MTVLNTEPSWRTRLAKGPQLLFDGEIYRMQVAGGINRYFSEIITRLPEDWKPVLSGCPMTGVNAPSHPQLKVTVPINFRVGRVNTFVRNWIWKPRLTSTTSLLHPTYYNLTSRLSFKDFRCPVVVTVYDMIYELFPKQMNSPSTAHDQREAVARADKIICISQSTEKDLLKLMPAACGKTEVIHLGCSFESQVMPSQGGPESCFLFVGARTGYKNFSFLLQAFAKAVSVNPGLQLIVAGKALDSQELWDIHFLKLDGHVIQVNYPDERELSDLYRQSLALLYPSKYEGFGLPPLEAMACGTIPVTSNTSSLPEIVGDAGILLEPNNLDDWASCILHLAANRGERGMLLSRARDQLKKFSWQACAARHVAVYKELLGL